MKELSIEEKAKRYDEAIKVAKELYFDPKIGIEFKDNLEKLFSEVKEKKNERIKKELIQLISCMHDADPRKKDWLGWLKKQGKI